MNYGEDTLFWYYVYLAICGKNLVIIDSPIYYYRIRSSSAMQSKSVDSITKHTVDLLEMSYIYKSMYEFGIKDAKKAKNTRLRQYSAVIGALTILPKSSLDLNKTLRALKSAELYPVPFYGWQIRDARGVKRKLTELIKQLFRFKIFYIIYYRICK